jgi:hypothetical protein
LGGVQKANGYEVDPNRMNVRAKSVVLLAALLFGGLTELAPQARAQEGVQVWVNRFNDPLATLGDKDACPSTVALGNGAKVFVTGYAGDWIGYYFATVAYSGSGVPLWTNRYDGALHDSDCATVMAVDAAGNVLVTGYSRASSGIGGSYSEVATIKYSSSVQAYLGIQPIGEQVILRWTNAGFNLQSAPGISGPFGDVSGATNAWAISTAGSQQYFRLKAN